MTGQGPTESRSAIRVIALRCLPVAEVFGGVAEIIVTEVIHVPDLCDKQREILPSADGVQYPDLLAILAPRSAALSSTIERRLSGLDSPHQFALPMSLQRGTRGEAYCALPPSLRSLILP